MAKKSSHDILKDLKLSVTDVRIALIETFLKSKKPLTIVDIKERLDLDVNESTLYRNLQKLVEKQFLQMPPSLDGFTRYEKLQGHSHHHHHIICLKCNTTSCLDSCVVNSMFKDEVDKKGFKLVSHSLELFGLCEKCQKAS